MSESRELRVFISSTFRDMQGERDELVKRVFPRVRLVCEQRGVAWSEVDLRWGVTDEQRDAGRVLPICLQEIDNCRPYFIGLLGERYGWVPQSLPPKVVAQEPWLAAHASRSLTDLEMMHAVLRDPARADRALFYFRDASYLERLPAGADPADYRCEGPEEAAKLAELKRAIRASGVPVRDAYADPAALGALVLEDLTAIIDRLFPANSVPGEASGENALHASAEADLSRAHVGFARYVPRMVGGAAPLVVTGPPGAGKSAFLARFAQAVRRGEIAGHPADRVIAHYGAVGMRGGGWQPAIARLTAHLRLLAGMPSSEIARDPAGLRVAFMAALTTAASRGPLVLVLDDLEALLEGREVLDLTWLPPGFPPGVKLVTSSGPGAVLGELQSRGWAVVPLEPLARQERAQVAADWLAHYGKTLAPERLARIADAGSTANPRHLRVVLEELRLLGHHEKIEETIDRYLAATDLPALLDQLLARYEADYDQERSGWVARALALLWAARRGLLEVEMRDILGSGGNPLPGAVWSPFFAAARQVLRGGAGLLAPANASVRDAIERRYLVSRDEQARVHAELGEYFRSRLECGPMGKLVWLMAAATGRPMHDPRRLDEAPWQLAAAGRWEALVELLVDANFFEEMETHRAFEHSEYWRRIEGACGLRRLEALRPVLENPSANANMVAGAIRLLREGGQVEAALSLAERSDSTLALWGTAADRDRVAQQRYILLRELGRLDEAEAFIAAREASLRTGGDGIERANAIRLRGDGLMQQGETAEALHLFEQAELIANAAGAAQASCGARLSRVSALIVLSDVDGAQALLDEVTPVIRALDSPALHAMWLARKARIAESRGELAQAIELERESGEINRRSGDAPALRASLQNQAEIERKRGDSAAALKLLEEKERLCREAGDQAGLARCASSRAQVLLAGSQPDAALAALQEQERLWVALAGANARFESFRNVVESLLGIGKAEPAAQALAWRIERGRRENDDPFLAELLIQLGAILAQELGRPHEARPLLQEAAAISTRIGRPELAELAGQLAADCAPAPRARAARHAFVRWLPLVLLLVALLVAALVSSIVQRPGFLDEFMWFGLAKSEQDVIEETRPRIERMRKDLAAIATRLPPQASVGNIVAPRGLDPKPVYDRKAGSFNTTILMAQELADPLAKPQPRLGPSDYVPFIFLWTGPPPTEFDAWARKRKAGRVLERRIRSLDNLRYVVVHRVLENVLPKVVPGERGTHGYLRFEGLVYDLRSGDMVASYSATADTTAIDPRHLGSLPADHRESYATSFLFDAVRARMRDALQEVTGGVFEFSDD